MKYAIKRVLYRLCRNWWLSILMVVEIAMGISVFTYSLNLHYSLVKEENKVKHQERDMALQILSKEEVSEEKTALTLQDYNKIQQLSEGEAYLYIGIPEFYTASDKNYNYTLLLVDFEKFNLEKRFAYWGSNVREIMDQDLLSGYELQNKKMPEILDKEVWNTEVEDIVLQDCILIPVSYMEEIQGKIASGWIHMEWNSQKMKNAEKTIEKIEEYLTTAHGDSFNYRIYYPEIELRNHSEKVKTSIQAINKASVLFLLMVFVGMLVIFHLIFEHRKESYGVSLACGANNRQLFKEIFGEILFLNGFGTIIGSGVGVLMTYHLNLQIMIGYIEVVGDLRTILLDIMICFIISFIVSTTIYQKLKREKIVRLLNVY